MAAGHPSLDIESQHSTIPPLRVMFRKAMENQVGSVRLYMNSCPNKSGNVGLPIFWWSQKKSGNVGLPIFWWSQNKSGNVGLPIFWWSQNKSGKKFIPSKFLGKRWLSPETGFSRPPSPGVPHQLHLDQHLIDNGKLKFLQNRPETSLFCQPTGVSKNRGTPKSSI